MKISFVNYYNSKISNFHFHITKYGVQIKEIKNCASIFLLQENKKTNCEIYFVKFENKKINFWQDDDTLSNFFEFNNIKQESKNCYIYYIIKLPNES